MTNSSFGLKQALVFTGTMHLITKSWVMLRGCDGIICLGKFAQEEVKSFIEICSNIVFLDMKVEHYNITSLTMD